MVLSLADMLDILRFVEKRKVSKVAVSYGFDDRYPALFSRREHIWAACVGLFCLGLCFELLLFLH